MHSNSTGLTRIALFWHASVKAEVHLQPQKTICDTCLTQKEEEELKEVPTKLWSKGPTDVGLMKGVFPVQIRPKTEYRPCMRQYPLKPDTIEGIRPVLQELMKAKVIVLCEDSPCNTPLFPVQKQAPAKGWRMVQDLQAVNNAVCQRAPCVPYLHTLLNSLKADS